LAERFMLDPSKIMRSKHRKPSGRI